MFSTAGLLAVCWIHLGQGQTLLLGDEVCLGAFKSVALSATDGPRIAFISVVSNQPITSEQIDLNYL
jgi:hypothetical protein